MKTCRCFHCTDSDNSVDDVAVIDWLIQARISVLYQKVSAMKRNAC